MTRDEARALTDRILRSLDDVAPLIEEAVIGRAWVALGYDSWDAYVRAEFGGPLRLARPERQEAVARLASQGLSTRAIGAALGVSEVTVRRDGSGATFDAPDSIRGLDGKSYAPRTVRAVVIDRTLGADGKPRPIPQPHQEHRPRPVVQESPIEATEWYALVSVMDAISDLATVDAAFIAATVPDRRRAATAKRLRKLGTYLGRIAWTLEGNEGTE